MDVDDDQDDAVNKVTTRRATIVNKKRAIVVKRPVPRENKKGWCSILLLKQEVQMSKRFHHNKPLALPLHLPSK